MLNVSLVCQDRIVKNDSSGLSKMLGLKSFILSGWFAVAMINLLDI